MQYSSLFIIKHRKAADPHVGEAGLFKLKFAVHILLVSYSINQQIVPALKSPLSLFIAAHSVCYWVLLHALGLIFRKYT